LGSIAIDPNLPGGVSIDTNVAADSQGDFLVTWFRVDVEGDAVVYARRVDGNGVFAGPAQPVTNGGGFRASAVATDPAGNKSKTKTLRFGVKKRPRR
jgi:hypothetical protein